NGGWITVQGDAEIVEYPKKLTHGCPGGINNVISIKLSENNVDGSIIKIIGAKDKKFNASLDSAKRITVKKGGLALNQFKEEKEESALKVDDNIVFSIKASAEEVASIIEG
ncbi:MAG: UDP-N-acetylglucosamine pyrophosphorylase, partial [Clostridiaceae bacterium]|nr:UDP-N-acetylglucosamine pyrophosphorylase [Clostridiaceae bacterium]